MNEVKARLLIQKQCGTCKWFLYTDGQYRCYNRETGTDFFTTNGPLFTKFFLFSKLCIKKYFTNL